MPKGRMLNRCISTSRRIESMSEWAQLLFDRLVIWADDFGLMEGDPFVIKASVKPLSTRDPREFGEAVAEMIRIGAVTAYVVGPRVYLHVDKHDDQQSGLHKRTKSHCPDPSEGARVDASAYARLVAGETPFPESPGVSAPEEKRREQEVEEKRNPPVVPLPGDTHTASPEKRNGAPAEQKKRGEREKFEIAPDFQPEPEDREWARAEERMTDAEIDQQTARFVKHHRAKGNRFKRPGLAWRNWITGRFIGGKKDSHDGNNRRAADAKTLRSETGPKLTARDFGQRTAADILNRAKR